MLCLAMLADVCSAAGRVGPVLVVATDVDAEAVARATGAAVVRDPTPDAGLNASLEAAIPATADGVLVVASDLPACSAADLEAVGGFDGVRLAGDAAGTGTNALWRKPSDAIPLAFGPGSAAAHRQLAAERGVGFQIVRRPGLALDVDGPEHLKEAWDAPIGANTRSALEDLGFPDRPAAW